MLFRSIYRTARSLFDQVGDQGPYRLLGCGISQIVPAGEADLSGDLLDPGDLEEALTAASAIGDDRLQREAGGRVVPDSFTHGTSEQRVRWFRQGFESGKLEDCDTFAAGR